MKYEVFLEPEVHRARTRLPGNVRQRMRQAITGLAAIARPDEMRRF